MTDTSTRVRQIITAQLALDNAPSDNATIASLKADSLDALQITLVLEDAFGISITDDEADAADTVGKCIALVERLVADRAGEVVF